MSKVLPLVSIVCLTYNHSEYLRDCLNGFVMQQTSFPVEILIFDDASVDTTPDIIKEYVDKYPDIIIPTIYSENQYSKGLGFLGLREGFKNAKGKYIAYCEGDDYWTDALKLQKQVDFLENNSRYEICAHETLIRNDIEPNQDGLLFSQTNVNIFFKRDKEVYTFKDTLTGNIFHISSLMFRNVPFTFPAWINRFSACDMVLFMLLAQYGDIYVSKEVMSVYRNNFRSLTSTSAEYASQISFNNISVSIVRLMNLYWNRKYQHLIYPIIARYYMRSMFVYLSKSNRNFPMARKMARVARKYDYKTYLKYLFIESYCKLKKHV